MTHTPRLLVPAVLGLALVGIAATTGFAGTNASGPVQCGIAEKTESGMLSIEGKVLSSIPVDGSYSFRVQAQSPGGGSSQVNQGGAFTAAANDAIALGKVTLNSGARYDAELAITANGVAVTCDMDINDLR